MTLRIRNFGVLSFIFVLALGIRSRTALGDEGGAGFLGPWAIRQSCGGPVRARLGFPNHLQPPISKRRRRNVIPAWRRDYRWTRNALRSRKNHTDLHVFLFGRGWSGSHWSGSQFRACRNWSERDFIRPGWGSFSVAKHQRLFDVSDLYPSATLKWRRANNNYMIYMMEGAPTGSYSVSRIANIGLNHWSADAGGAYTYFNNTNEFSAALGFTYNFENRATHYQNGVNSHFDWGASHFVSQPTHLGLVGYSYYQLTEDSGTGAILGAFKSRVSAVGPQVGHSFGSADNPWYVNVKAYYEFGARNRATG